MMKLWGGRFSKATHSEVEIFTASIEFDACLAEVDILGSIAHAKTLGHSGILTNDEVEKLCAGLTKLQKKIQDGKVQFQIAHEDIHMNIEKLLHDEIGELASKLHTGRSRNDQVALDLHLYLREKTTDIIHMIHALQTVLVEKAEVHVDTLLPGYTHLQRALPIRLAHHFLAYFWMFQRDIERLQDAMKRISLMPLGAGALAGSGFPLDRAYTAELLGFENIYENSLDAVSDRDFVVEFLSVAASIMMHLSRLSEELILWSSQEFSFIELDDAFCTGSSMMPQKKNPDVPELVRGKTGRVYGTLFSLLTILKGLPLAYNKDMQEDKEGLFDAIKTVTTCLSIYTPMIQTMKINTETMRSAVENDYSNATGLANYLTSRGVPFRHAHEIIGKIVSHCIEKKLLLAELPLKEYQKFSTVFAGDLYDVLKPEFSVDTCSVRGGTGKPAVIKQLEVVKQKIAALEK
ncbi:MAG: argininosuccinate lyase [Proteobacteria bacterium]|nr:argininosuccinate lyase [Pseudomonadota bacterium]